MSSGEYLPSSVKKDKSSTEDLISNKLLASISEEQKIDFWVFDKKTEWPCLVTTE